jgi:quercetin dioxygenase-like cupin family protein
MVSARRYVVFALSVLICFAVTLLLGASGVAQQPSGRPQAEDSTTDSGGNPLPGTSIPCAPIAEKHQELGCYVVARQRLGSLPQGTPLAWQLDVFPSRSAAEAAKGQRATIVEAFDRIWLFTIASPDWRAGVGAEHVATVGPLPLNSAPTEYTAMYLATTFRPGLSSFVHAHPGPEAWFLVSGEQCLETPEGAMRGRAGDRVVVRGNLPMILHATGTEIRRNFTLVLHDATKAATERADNWTPKGLCK